MIPRKLFLRHLYFYNNEKKPAGFLKMTYEHVKGELPAEPLKGLQQRTQLNTYICFHQREETEQVRTRINMEKPSIARNYLIQALT